MEIKNSRVLVTGGSSGLGKSLAKNLVELGARVLITGRDASKVEQVASEIGAIGVASDVANDNDIDRVFETIESEWGGLDVLVNNAGIGEWSAVEELNREQFDRVFQVNVYGAAVMAAKAVPLFKKQGKGNIINIASTAGTKGFGMGSVYASSKFALRGMTQCWQAELRKENIRVMLVNPSEVPTAFAQENREERDLADKKLTPQEISHTIIACLQMDDRGMIPEVSIWASNPF